MKTTFLHRDVEYEIEFGSHSACDSYIGSAIWLDTGTELNEDELLDLDEQEQDNICNADVEKYGYHRD